MSRKPPSVHTVKKGEMWVNKQGGEQVGPASRTQERAAEKGRDIAEADRTEHVIHRQSGEIREKNSYGNDPNPPKDQR